MRSRLIAVNGSKAVAGNNIRVADLMKLCLEEHERRFAGYDPRLVRFALRFMRA